MSAEVVAVAAVLLAGVRVLADDAHGPRSMAWASLVGLAAAVLLLSRQEVITETKAAREQLLAHTPHQGRDGGYVSSDTCIACHPGEYHSWHRSYHRTMTQLATPAAVVAPFDDVHLAAGGRTYDLSRRGDAYFVDMVDLQAERAQARNKGPAPGRREVQVVMTTGSHAMQTYWVEAKDTREVFNLPWVYEFASRRWLPRESVFLRDPAAGPFKQTWNDNCIGCHSTGPQPKLGKQGADTRVGELGIACEACHGPGAAHVEANRDPLRRYQKHLAGAPDPTIVNPARLDPERSSQVCGQCHSVNLINDPKGWYAGDGHVYRPGDDLGASREVLLPRSDPDNPGLKWAVSTDANYLDQYFWRDGMVRVSGREYNGMVESKCHTAGGMTCLSCHSMHGDEPDMQPKPGLRGAAACLQCHPQFGEADALTAHTHHPAGSSGSDCLNCHMPYTTYGLLRGLRSHLVDSPTVAATQATGRANACNACHLDKPLAWADERLSSWYGQPSQASTLTEEDRSVAAEVQWLLRGDAGQRALAAWYAGWAAAQDASGADWQAAHLAELLTDPYDAVRLIAARSLKTLPGYADSEYDAIAPPAQRATDRDAARAAFPTTRPAPAVLIGADGRPDRAAIDRLLSNRNDRILNLTE